MSGFTLIELLVVIAIIAILTAILLPVFATVRENARESNSLSNMHQISTAIAQFRLDNHAPPDVLFGYVYYMYGTTTPVPMSKALAQAEADAAAHPTTMDIGTTFPGLYPEYIKDYRVFIDPNNPADPTSASDIVSANVNLLGTTGKLTPKSENFYTADAYDISPAITGLKSVSLSTYVPRYQSSWTDIDNTLDCTGTTTSLCGTNDEDLYEHQLRWQNPPASTYVDSTTYHVQQADKVLVLWDNGSAGKVPVSTFLSCSATGACTNTSNTSETPTDVSAAGGVSGVNFWKLDPTGI
jgi:prepilin-type N-terminal cleavage/methylation domain-containing protein